MRIRSIKPEFWSSEDISAIPDYFDRLLFIGLWSYVDDNAVGRDNEKLIAAKLFPLDDHADVLARIRRGLASLSAAGLIARYSCPEGRRYLMVTGWHHQKIDKPTRSPLPRLETVPNPVTCDDPEPPEQEPTPPRILPESSRAARESSGDGYGTRDTGSRDTGSRDQGIVEEGMWDEPPRAAHAAPPPKSTRGTRIPEDFTLTDQMRSWAVERVPGLDLDRSTEKFRNHYTAATGSKAVMRDWSACWRNWMLGDHERIPPRIFAPVRAGPQARSRHDENADVVRRQQERERAAENGSHRRLQIGSQ